MKIALCSTKDSLRERWRTILAGQDHLMHQVAFVEGLMSLLQEDEVSLILLHRSFADDETIRDICRRFSSCKIFILADEPSEKEGVFFLRIGVSGYANSYISSGRFSEAVKMVLSGRVWFSQEVISSLIHSINVDKISRDEGEPSGLDSVLSVLSEREKEIAVLVSEGMSNSDIGEKLFISERTVKSHLRTIFDKTGAKSRLQLALLILRRSKGHA